MSLDTTVTMPTSDDLDQWPYVADDSPLWNLNYAADVSDALPDETTCYEQNIPWHEIMGWLFDIAEASYLIDMSYNDNDIHMLLHRMQFKPSPMLGTESLNNEDREGVRVAYEALVAKRVD